MREPISSGDRERENERIAAQSTQVESFDQATSNDGARSFDVVEKPSHVHGIELAVCAPSGAFGYDT